MKTVFILSFIAAIMLCLPADASATTYYVATTGNNSNPGTTLQPWLTLQHAVDTVVAGDTILVKSGTYAGCRIGRSGQANLPCTLKTDTGAAVLINAASPANRHNSNIEVELFDVTLSYWVIDGFEVSGALRYGIDLRDTDHVTVQNCFVHNSAVTGIFLAFCYHPLIQNNQSANNGEHGVYQSNSGDFPTIRGNTLHHNAGAGLHMNGDRNFTPGDGIISSALVEKNVVYENGTAGGSGINCDGVDDSIIRNNLIYNNHASGISLYATDGTEGSSRNKVYNNTIVMPADARWCINISASTEGQPNAVGNLVKNNILYNAHTFRGSITTYSGAVSGFQSDYNVVVSRFSSDDGGTNMTLAQWQALGYDLHSFVATPTALFVSPAGNNYHLKSGSPAADAAATFAEVTDDLDNVLRPQGIAFDMGCFELSGAPPAAHPSIGLYNPASGGFFLRNSNSTGIADVSFAYGPGGLGWIPLTGDWNNDRTTTVGLYNPAAGTFFLRNSNSTGIADVSFAYGPAGLGWIPLVGDWNGDGTATIGLYNPAASTFFLRNSNSTGIADISFAYGPAGAGWIPLVGDWNGDGVDTVGLYNPTSGTFFLRNSNSTGIADISFAYGPGGLGWIAIVGDWNGDGSDTVGLYNPTMSAFFLRNSNSTGIADLAFAYGPAGAGWAPLVGDWDGL